MSGEPLVVADPTGLAGHEGADLGPTAPRTIDAAAVLAYRESTGDRSDDGSSGNVPAFMLLGLVNLFLPDLLVVQHFSMGVNVGLDGVTFGQPVNAPAELRARGRVLSVTPAGDGVQVVVQVTLHHQGAQSGEPCCTARTVSRFFP